MRAADRHKEKYLKNLKRQDLLDELFYKTIKIIYDTPTGRRTVYVTLQESEIARLDNYPIGFETTREAALFDMHCINALEVHENAWITIPVGNILEISIP